MVDLETPSDQCMDRYHEYLEKNYVGGCERFFSPTGFLEKFQKTVEIKSQQARNHVFVRDVDEAALKLEAAINTGSDVFDLTAEPGTGKTSVLPFRFPSKRVIVALPTPFDAWNAYSMATGNCNLRIKGLRLGDQSASVTYTDSYLAAYALMSNYMDYDILIVDECDSDRGVTKFLSEVKTTGKLLIRMSASHGRTRAGMSKSFAVTESKNMPDIRQGVQALAEFVKSNHKGRSLVLAPDAASAREVSDCIPESVLLTVSTHLGDMQRHTNDQSSSKVYVSDDTCGRALNLNLDALFDCQLITEYANVRPITMAELYQRTGRVGRNRPGWYFSPDIPTMERKVNDFDTVRHNVVRALAGVPQHGSSRLRMSTALAERLMDCPVEPYEEKVKLDLEKKETAVVSSGSSTGSSRDSFVSAGKVEIPQSSADGLAVLRTVKSPSWMAYYGGLSSLADETGKKAIVDTFVVKTRDSRKAFMRRSSSSSSSGGSVGASGAMSLATGRSSGSLRHFSHASPILPTAENAPYSVSRRQSSHYMPSIDLPLSPPVMDLTMLTYDLDWPGLIRDRLARGGDLPTLVPPASWRHTSAGGFCTDWLRRLEDMAVNDNSFDDEEFEVVCRAWNKLVGQAWVRRSPGLSNAKDAHRIEYCVRYFQSYFLLGSVG